MQENKESLSENMMAKLQDRITELSINIEKMKLAEYVELLNKPRRLLWINFISGIARGLGIAVGFAILGAVVLVILQYLVKLNLPFIGDFIADIVNIVQHQLKARTY